MIGSIIGDVAGSVYEFQNIKTTMFPLFASDCRVTDDSVMTAAIAEAILSHRETGEDLSQASIRCMRKWGSAFPDSGYGGRFILWLTHQIDGPYNSFGNGSAMRASPCADLADSLDQALSYAEITASVTHNHPEGVRGAYATAGAGYLARAGNSKEEIRRFVEGLGYDLSFSLDDIRVSYSFDELYAMKKGNAFGYIINVSPYFIFKFKNFILINNLNISYVNVGDKEYYYDPRTSILHKKSEFELINDFFLLGRISLFYIGGYYGLTYLINSKHLSHKFGIAAMVNFKFLKERLLFNIGASAGLHVGLPHYNNETFIEFKMSLAYKIL